ncbi:membrane lipoprotein lipid attachment site-containing protein [Klebsiella pneumoniae]|uniref:membrane lipoprotein lipid attachment site-containing protein n=1 Tax=Klebsiella pneumoniae TaxID=573 RepID=UPI001154F8F0|nr:membrane lipoprotein lipid attachment site-containing protein [Klebsiella pneumoniae]NBF33819.1 hypothetical protein [Klebsiella pneumoniae]
MKKIFAVILSVLALSACKGEPSLSVKQGMYCTDYKSSRVDTTDGYSLSDASNDEVTYKNDQGFTVVIERYTNSKGTYSGVITTPSNVTKVECGSTPY